MASEAFPSPGSEEQPDNALTPDTAGEKTPVKNIEGTGLSAKEFDRITARIPKKYRRLATRVLAEVIPAKEHQGLTSYVGVWELSDHRWMIVTGMLGGTDHVTKFAVANRSVEPGKTKVREETTRQHVIVGRPEEVFNPMVMSRNIMLRRELWMKLAENLKTLDGGRLAQYAPAIPLAEKLIEPRTTHHISPSREEEKTEPVEGVAPPTEEDTKKLIPSRTEIEERRRARNAVSPTEKLRRPKPDEGEITEVKRQPEPPRSS